MRTRHDAFVRAPAPAVFAVAADVESWPALHRAYRWCRVLEREPLRLVFEMGGVIRGWPARWTAVQEREPDRRITFRHIRGITTSMLVEWSFEERGGGTQVIVAHDLSLRWPLIGRTASDLIVGPVFIDWIARQTLDAVKAAVEQLQGPG